MRDEHTPAPRVAVQSRGLLDRTLQRLVLNQFQSWKHGQLQVSDSGAAAVYGETAELTANLQIHRSRFFRRAVLGGDLSAANAYLEGDWDCDDLTSFFRIFVRNQTSPGFFQRTLRQFSQLGHRLIHRWRDNSKAGSRRNISAHYDIGNEFYRLWLDPTLAYSSGIFRHPDSSLAQASQEKFDRVCRKLELSHRDHLLEIGTGWGGFALHAAQNFDCRVTTTTISAEQYAIAAQRVQAAGLCNRIHLLQADYRDLTGQFSKLASIEMIEAVGHRHLDNFFSRCSQLLQPDGTMVLQAIVMPEQNYSQYVRSVDFIQRYIFPGGCLPSIGAMLRSVGRATDLRLVHLEDFAPHYAETLRRWRENFESRLQRIRDLSYSEKFIRLWRYYLCYCEAAFEERCVGVVQAQFDKPRCLRDPLRVTQHAASERPHTRHSTSSPESAGPTGRNGKEHHSVV